MYQVSKQDLINDAKSSNFNQFIQNTKMLYGVQMNISDGMINVEINHPNEKLVLQFDEKNQSYLGNLIKG